MKRPGNTTVPEHRIEISCESPSRNGALVLNGGHRARCACSWSSDCYAMLSDTQRAIEVHLRRAQREDFEGLIARSSIGAAIADIKTRGIDAHLVDLEREMRSHRRRFSKKIDADFAELARVERQHRKKKTFGSKQKRKSA